MINILSPQIANMIAAGEVVDRPASAVKELLENSIDAGAHKITVEIKNGGITLIRITDDGCGMDENDVKKCVFRHATSKICCESDLIGISTLGFRGEALAAISSVSQMRIMTKRENEDIGRVAYFEGGEIKTIEPAGCRTGTTIMVENLFYNIPARKKFLRSERAETASVSAVIEKIALSRPDIGITYITDGDMRIRTDGDGRLQNVIYAILGRDFAQKIQPVCDMTEGIKVEGFIGTPENCRSNRNGENFFINGRYVRCGTATAALEQAFSSYMMKERFPVCVLSLTFNPASVDVNVHPQKLEVKFTNEKPIFNAVYCAVRNVLENNLPKAKERYDGDSFRLYQDVLTYKADSKEEAEGIANEKELLKKKYEQIVIPSPEPIKTRENIDDGKPSESINISQKQEQENNAKISPISSDKPVVSQTSVNGNNLWNCGETKNEKIENHEKHSQNIANPEVHNLSTIAEQHVDNPVDNSNDFSTIIENGKNACVRSSGNEYGSIPDYKISGVLFNTYIIVEQGKKILVIDKHAAHERIIYEKLKSNLTNGKPAMQSVLLPICLSLSQSELAAAESEKDELNKIGFDFNAKGLTSYPLGMTSQNAKEVFEELALRLAEGIGDPKTDRRIMLEKALYQASCKAAVKGGREDNADNIDWITRQVLTRNEIRYCPHGRPVVIELTKDQFEKRFERM